MPLVVIVFFMAIFGAYSANMAEREAKLYAQSRGQVEAVGAWAYFDALRTHRTANPTVTGVISDASVVMPAGVSKGAVWTNQIFDGRLFVYEATPTGGVSLASRIGDHESRHGAFVGLRSGATLATSRGYETGIAVPSDVPVGSIVMVTR
jgi:hypothetical protein